MSMKGTAAVSSTSSSTSNKRQKSSHTLGNISLHIVPAKLNEDVYSDLVALAKRHVLKLYSIAEADVIITKIQMRRRLEWHVDWETAVREHSGIESLL
jgi:hypothetical protein